MTFVAILLFLGIAWYFLFKKGRRRNMSLPETWHKILENKVVYYRNLTDADQKKFGQDVMKFLAGVKITGVKTDVDIVDKLLISSSAVIPVFGFPDWEYSFIDEVLLYPSSFDRNFNIGSKDKFIQGMVGNGAMEGKMILSKRALHAGFMNDRDKKNVGIHEFIHLIDKEDGVIDGIPTVFNNKSFALPWLDLIDRKIESIKSSGVGINPYGATNKQEFLAVAGEYFFERPHLLNAHHPQLYEMLSQAFNQDPSNLIRPKKERKIAIGRNDLCPCGSGLKFKKCCLNK